ncbi:PREDICTED: chymotrypsin-2-like isoform X2 [Trachymyrmex septentrionalis]|uniref:chymotrypsin-2-like isoform X2 n=1 Tax=Trachymyrmex septentrionalis TaxID=34720 RepID=UPI00084F25B0|nr:PREDICTED: chymotrypsin-2-like isoform X2 [Trachymyrmex septentrionalis]
MFSITSVIISYLICHTYDSQILSDNYDDALDSEISPYHVSLKLLSTEEHICSGAIIHKKYVITAANCLEDHDSADIVVDVGNNELYIPENRYIAYSLIIHPHYNKTQNINDIGLINLTKEIGFNKYIKSIDLISYDENFEGHVFITAHWRKFWSFNLEHLQKINVTGFSQTSCGNTYLNITNKHICTIQMSQDTCDEKFGRPLTYKGNLVGILGNMLSFGKWPCVVSTLPDVFTKVYYYRQWINDTINADSKIYHYSQSIDNSINVGINEQFNFFGPIFIFRSYIQDRLKYSLKKSRINQRTTLAS